MDQQSLRELEYRCIQEQPPWCSAACPLHVDVRAFTAQAAAGKWDAARKILERTMPFPGILGRICDHPCENVCKRLEVDEAVAVGALERCCIENSTPQSRPLVLPGKKGEAAVFGAGLAGLTVALDLARKGFRVSLRYPGETFGAGLTGLAVPKEEFDQAAALLKRIKVDLREAEIPDQAALDRLLENGLAVFLDLDEPAARVLAEGETPDAATLVLRRSGLFAGGGPDPEGGYSPIRQVADGRRASGGMDRFLQKVSLTAQRETEGPQETRLYTNIEGVAPAPRIIPADPGAGLSGEEGRAEAGRCLRCECMECVKACVYLENYKGYPKLYARQIYNNESIVKGHHKSNKMIDSCALCGQCEVVCPNDFSMANLCLSVRESMVRRGKMPPSAYDFALEDLRFNMGPHFALAQNAPGAEQCAYAFFPGCQLAGSAPNHVESVYDWLREALDDSVGLILGCCGAPALWAGERELFGRTLDALRKMIRPLGAPTLVTACSTCYDTLRRHAPDVNTTSLWEIMDRTGATPSPAPGRVPAALAVHDPCTTREHPKLRAAARSLAGKCGVEVQELPYNNELTSCCGYGGLMSCANPGLAREVAERRAQQHSGDYLAYCAMCRDVFASTGKRVWHLLDLLFPEAAGENPAARSSTGFSERRENRSRLRRNMLKALWGEEAGLMEPHEAVNIAMDADVASRMEDRRILKEDLQRVILHAQETGLRLQDPTSGRYLAYHRPVRVTYWVEYAPEEDGYRVFNAYSHRMALEGDRQ